MRSKILLIYQDCHNCGNREEWYKEQQKLAKGHNLKIVPTPYNAPGAKDIILAAQDKGVKQTLLFYTDGKKFGHDIKDFIKAEALSEPDKKA